MRGAGFGVVGDLVIGIMGAVIGMWLLPRLGVHLGAGLVAATVNATIGALLLRVIIKLVRDQGGWGGLGRRMAGTLERAPVAEAFAGRYK